MHWSQTTFIWVSLTTLKEYIRGLSGAKSVMSKTASQLLASGTFIVYFNYAAYAYLSHSTKDQTNSLLSNLNWEGIEGRRFGAAEQTQLPWKEAEHRRHYTMRRPYYDGKIMERKMNDIIYITSIIYKCFNFFITKKVGEPNKQFYFFRIIRFFRRVVNWNEEMINFEYT